MSVFNFNILDFLVRFVSELILGRKNDTKFFVFILKYNSF